MPIVCSFLASLVYLVHFVHLSYICATFVVESMAIANAAKLHARCRRGEPISSSTDDNNPYLIRQRIEVVRCTRSVTSSTTTSSPFILLHRMIASSCYSFASYIPQICRCVCEQQLVHWNVWKAITFFIEISCLTSLHNVNFFFHSLLFIHFVFTFQWFSW